MKKFIKFIIFITFTLLFTSCSFQEAQYIIPKEKPSSNYYTSELREKINKNEDYVINIFDLNIYKYYEVNEAENSIIPEFIDLLNSDNYNAEIEEDLIPEYKIIIEFSNAKYIIKAYSDKLVSIHPWDGVYPEDKISMDEISDYYNLYKYCEYIKKVSSGFEG